MSFRSIVIPDMNSYRVRSNLFDKQCSNISLEYEQKWDFRFYTSTVENSSSTTFVHFCDCILVA